MLVFKGTLGGLCLAAGLWLTASASMAAPQPGRDMPLGSSALAPQGYIGFCERKPQDCGDDVATVTAQAWRADADRIKIAALLSGRAPTLTTASFGRGATTPPVTAAPAAAPETLLPAPTPQTVGETPMAIETEIAFIDPASEAQKQADARAPRMTPALWSLLSRVNGDVNGAIQRMSDLSVYGLDDYWNTPLEDGIRRGDCEDYVLEKQRALIAAGVPRQALNIAVVTTRWGEGHAVLLVATSEGEYVLDNLSPWIVTWREAPYRWDRRQVNGEAFNWVMIADPARLKSEQHLLIASTR